MRQRLYNALVNKVPGIAFRYHKAHDGTHGIATLFSWVYLLLLNIGYHLLFLRFLGKKPAGENYETHRLPIRESESQQARRKNPKQTVEQFVETLSQYDVVSFDVFDTLIFRPFDTPTDLFYFLDEPIGILDFHRIRMEMEHLARLDHFKLRKNYEVSFREIWEKIETEVGPSAERGMEIEQQLELAFCYPNPFLQEVYRELRERGKRIIITTDMYLPPAFLEELLAHCGYTGFEQIYVSNVYEKSKGEGRLYEVVKRELGPGVKLVHVGDNIQSDVKNAKAHGLAAIHYPNVNTYSMSYRAHDMSALIGSAYRGIVDNHIYSGSRADSMAYEYGYIYGGLFVVGYCSFIHDYCQRNQVDKLLFLSRDGDTLKQIYDRMFPGENTAYVLWGRLPATKLMADMNRYDFFRRFLWHKASERKTAAQLLKEAGLSALISKLANQKQKQLGPDTVISSQNADLLKKWLQKNWDAVLKCHEEEQLAAKQYFSTLLKGTEKAVAIDIGWAGSGAASLAYLVERVWDIPCRIVGVIAGTNTIHNAEPDASEAMLQNGRLTAYLYSQQQNRDLLKKHDLNRDYNIYWELLLSSPTPSFLGYSYDRNGNICAKLGSYEANQTGIRDIQRGILDFAEEYLAHFGSHTEMLRISGRDAYAPMLVAASYNERYLKEIKKQFRLEISVGAEEESVDEQEASSTIEQKESPVCEGQPNHENSIRTV